MIKNAMAVPHTRHHVVVLTLEKHKDGSWITRLIEALRQQDADAEVTLVALESILEERSCLVVDEGNSNGGIPGSTTVLVNRVSDAADPILVKACIAVLGLVSSRGTGTNDHTMIPVVNGAAAYALCTNKWCHHALFHRAGLATPRTMKFFRPEPATIQKAMDDWEDPTVERFLLKPNAAGFGAGIVECRRGRVNVLDGKELLLPQASDGVLLLQEYIESPHVYRVWFLDGRILCGVVRNDPTSGTSVLLLHRSTAAWLLPTERCLTRTMSRKTYGKKLKTNCCRSCRAMRTPVRSSSCMTNAASDVSTLT
jgi:hypothetical protein